MRIRTGLAALVVLAAATPAAQAEGFEGFYTGVTIGAKKQKLDWMTTDVRYRNDTRIDPSDPDNEDTIEDGTSLPAFLSDPDVKGLKDTAMGLGLVFGYNFELAPNLIVGVELAGGSAPTYNTIDGTVPGLGTTSDDPLTYAAVRTSKPLVAGLRLGYVVAPNTLAYLRGNYERITVSTRVFSTECPSSNLNFDPAGDPTTDPPETMPIPCDRRMGNPNLAGRHTGSDTVYSWAYGGGVEYMVSEMASVRLEYRTAKFGKTKAINVLPESDGTFGADAVMDLKKSQVIELGVLVHF